MKSLFLLRHAKSDWDAGADDQERPLNQRGRRTARVMGRFLELAGAVPDAVVCSTALRARQTLEIATEAGEWRVPVRLEPALYTADQGEVLAVVRGEDDDRASLLVVGHEPTLSALAGELIGVANLRFPTAAMTRIDFDVARWAEIAPGRGELVWLVPPRLFTDGAFDFAR